MHICNKLWRRLRAILNGAAAPAAMHPPAFRSAYALLLDPLLFKKK